MFDYEIWINHIKESDKFKVKVTINKETIKLEPEFDSYNAAACAAEQVLREYKIWNV